ncbi:MAG: hypothetical protein ACYTEX_28075 [Planctomycetota bacterium]|jgi:hypothetical protein
MTNVTIYEQECFGQTHFRTVRDDGWLLFGRHQTDFPSQEEALSAVLGEFRREKLGPVKVGNRGVGLAGVSCCTKEKRPDQHPSRLRAVRALATSAGILFDRRTAMSYFCEACPAYSCAAECPRAGPSPGLTDRELSARRTKWRKRYPTPQAWVEANPGAVVGTVHLNGFSVKHYRYWCNGHKDEESHWVYGWTVGKLRQSEVLITPELYRVGVARKPTASVVINPEPLAEDNQCPKCGGELVSYGGDSESTGQLVCVRHPFTHTLLFRDRPDELEGTRHIYPNTKWGRTPKEREHEAKWRKWEKKAKRCWRTVETRLPDGTTQTRSVWVEPTKDNGKKAKPVNGKPSLELLQRYADYGATVRGIGLTPRPFAEWAAQLKGGV